MKKRPRMRSIDGFDWISKETTSKECGLSLSGRAWDHDSGVYYFLPVNANLERLRRTAVPFTEMKNTVASLAGKDHSFH